MTNALTVFLCSTYEDLAVEREQVLDAVRRLQLQHDSMEFFGARQGQPIETCLEEVRRSDLLVVLLGHRYGSLVPGLGISFSEAEYREGQRLVKPCLVYLRGDDVPVLPRHIERDPEKIRLLDRWRADLTARHTVAQFSNAPQLAVQVAADLSRAVRALEAAQQSEAEARPRAREAGAASESRPEGAVGATPSERQPSTPTHLVDASGGGQFLTISAAIEAAQDGDRIVVRPGVYDKGLSLTKTLEIVGDGPLEDIVIQSEASEPAIWFSAPSGKISNLTLRGGWYGVEIMQGTLELDGCDISDTFTCIFVRADAEPLLRHNRIHGASNVGIQFEKGRGLLEGNEIFANQGSAVFFSGTRGVTLRRNRIHDNDSNGVSLSEVGRSTWEDNEIFGNKGSGISISGGNNPSLRSNRIYHNKRGVDAWDGGLGTLEGNEIFGNSRGIEISGENTHLTVRHNSIHDCESYGVEISSGRCTLEDNEIFANGMTGISISASKGSLIRRNRIHDNRFHAISIDKEGGGTFQENDLRGSVKPWLFEGRTERFSRREGNLED